MSLFPADIIAAAQASQAKWHIPASLTLAQWAVESAYGKDTPPGSNNPFGIKALPGQPAVLSPTSEDPSGSNRITGKQPFRKYASVAEAFDDHGRLLGLGAPYHAMVTTFLKSARGIDDVNRLANALTGVYAVAQNYGSTLIKVMKQNNLYQYDQQETSMMTTTAPKLSDAATTTTVKSPLPTITQSPKIDLGSNVSGIIAFLKSLQAPADATIDKLQASALSSVPFIGPMVESLFPHIASQYVDKGFAVAISFAQTMGTNLTSSNVPQIIQYIVEDIQNAETWLADVGINTSAITAWVETNVVAKLESVLGIKAAAPAPAKA